MKKLEFAVAILLTVPVQVLATGSPLDGASWPVKVMIYPVLFLMSVFGFVKDLLLG